MATMSCPASTKLHEAGFTETIDSGQMLLDHLARYREAKILP